MDRLGSVVFIAPARRAGEPGLSPGPGENFSLKLLTCQMVILKAKFSSIFRILNIWSMVDLFLLNPQWYYPIVSFVYGVILDKCLISSKQGRISSIIITVHFIAFLMNWNNNGFFPILCQFFFVPIEYYQFMYFFVKFISTCLKLFGWNIIYSDS